ncbi:putative conjugation-related ATPase [Weissella oryzae SG25]|uniref:Putative conjugation-related ATPase n=1 Tax=Weissella oryzae (strain DSM 25784 / JCM 18191 / LMG 30913 / SG25) TaxID=1329250 RepID=A0A069CVX8_WEIOS|nr:hypothetical protein [Weissella oryzae]GAK31547.1 putative conjugation-related ATPase [Weissella oryzae SG25]
MRNSTRNKLEARGFDLDFLKATENGAPIVFHSDFIQYGDGYATILSVYDYPKNAQGQAWFRELLGQSNTISVLKIGTEDRMKVEQALKRAASSAEGIVNDKWKDDGAKLAASKDYQTNLADLDAVVNSNATYKRLYVRLMVMDVSLPKLKERITIIKRKLSGYRMKVYSGEMATQYSQIFTPAMKVEHAGMSDKGFPMKAYALAGTYPFNYTFLNDPRGAFMGTSLQDGEMIFDPSFNDGQHRIVPYNLVVGMTRSGKSTWTKKNARALWARGDTLWIFDKIDEYDGLVDSMHGVHLTMDGTSNNINILQVFATVLLNNGKVDVIGSFHAHIDKIKTYYHTIKPTADTHELSTLGSRLIDFYIKLRMWSRAPEQHPEELKVLGLKNKDYPIMEDFINYLSSCLMDSQNLTPSEIERLENIKQIFDGLVQSYGTMVNSITTVPDLRYEQVVRLNTRGISALGKTIFNAQYFNILSLMSAYVTMNGSKQRSRLGKDFTAESIRSGVGPMPKYFWWIQDEADEIFNASHPMGITFGDNMMAQQAKNFFGTFVNFPGLTNVIPKGVMQDSAASRATTSFFGRFGTHAVFRSSREDTSRLRQVYSPNDVTDSQLNAINDLDQGQLLLNLVGTQATFMTMALTAEEEQLFKGGL